VSNRRFVSSGGDPYFTFQTGDEIGDATTIPGLGITWLGMQVRIDRLPTQKASPDELHPLVSFSNSYGLAGPILELGVTPSGRFAAANWQTGDSTQTPPGTILDTSRWYQLATNYDFLGGNFVLAGDFATLGAATAVSPVVPAPGYNSRIMLFNGSLGRTNMKASISKAWVSFDGAEFTYTYRFTEKTGVTLTPTRDLGNVLAGTEVQNSPAAAVALPALGIATAGVVAAIAPLWGSPPLTAPAYSWGLETDYTRIPRPVTAYTRISP
jgi:hypothetical protein